LDAAALGTAGLADTVDGLAMPVRAGAAAGALPVRVGSAAAAWGTGVDTALADLAGNEQQPSGPGSGACQAVSLEADIAERMGDARTVCA